MGRGKDEKFVQAVRGAIRETARNWLRSVVQEATEEELRAALREEDIRKAILDLIRRELHSTIRDLRPGTRRRPRTT